MRKLIIAAALAVTTLAAPALALSADPANSEIVVEGRREQLTKTLKSLLTEQSTGQIGRFETRLCPKVIGFPADWGAKIEDMVRKNAAHAGLGLQKEQCRPNALVILIDEPQRLVSELAKAEPEFFGNLVASDIALLKDKKRPLYSWRVVDVRDSEGVELGTIKSIPTGGGGPASGVPTSARIVRNAKARHIGENTRQDILLSFAVIDSKSAVGKTLRQLADAATMHLLLDIKPDAVDQGANNSILSLFADRPEGQELPERMSDLDRNMVAGLYAAKDNAYDARMQRSRIARHIEKEEKAAEQSK